MFLRKTCILLIAFILHLGYASAQRTDSLLKATMIYASQNNIEALRPIYEKIKMKMPHHVYLFADMALARNEENYDRVVKCVDSLYNWYPKQISKKSWLSLAEIKAEALRHLGKYEEMLTHCNKAISYLKRYGIGKNSLQELYLLKEKALQLKGNNDIHKLLQLGDKYLVFELDSLYNKVKDHDIDELTRLRSEFILTHTFHHTDKQKEVILQLIRKHGKELEQTELTTYITHYANLLIATGEWNELANWSRKISQIQYPHSAPITTYSKWANAFSAHPTSSLTSPLKTCSIPTTYEWPIIMDATINQGEIINCGFSMEQPYTLISESVANKSHVQVFKDTLTIITSNGMLQVSPAVIDELALGEIRYNHIFAYVAHRTNGSKALLNCTLGLNQIMELGKITFHPEYLSVDIAQNCQSNLVTDKKSPSLYLSHQGGLQLFTKHKHAPYPLSIDFTYPNNLLYHKNQEETETTESPLILIGNDTLNINHPQYVDYSTLSSNGVLGVPFLRHYHAVCFDFNKMQLTVDKEEEYLPVRGKFNYGTDIHYLERNAKSLMVENERNIEERLFLQQIIACGKNNPLKVSCISRQLRKDKSDFYNFKTEAEALFQTGHYTQAIALLQDLIEEKETPLQMNEQDIYEIQSMKQYFLLFAQEKRPYIQTHHAKSIHYKLNHAPYPKVKIHRKHVVAHFDPFSPHTIVSERQIKKFKIKQLGNIHGTEYGIIPKISCGHLVFHNIPCHILNNDEQVSQNIPDKGKGIRIGWNILRLLNQMSFSKNQLTLSTEPLTRTDNGANVYYTNQWHIETLEENDYQTYICVPHLPSKNKEQQLHIGDKQVLIPIGYQDLKQPTSKYIQWSDLLSEVQNITIDFKEMKWTLK